MLESAAAIVRTTPKPALLPIVILLIVLSVSSLSPAQSNELVTAPVDPTIRAVLYGQHAVWAMPRYMQGTVPGDTMLRHLTLILKRSPSRQKAFEQFLQQLQEPGSPNYHYWLTPVQLGKRFGASPHDVRAISQWLEAEGLRVNSVANNRLMIDFSGNAAQIGTAFATSMRYYIVDGEQRMAAAGDPQIPAALEAVIASVSGLNTVNDHPFHGAEQAEVPAQGAGDVPALSICNGSSCSYFIAPGDFYGIYDLDRLLSNGVDGRGETIAIIGRARVYDPDIENFQSLTQYGTKDPIVIVPPNGLDPGPPAGTGGTASGDQAEATLDVQRATSTAPGAMIDLVISADDNGTSGLRIAAEYVVDTDPVPAQIMNISFGACEADRTLSDVQFWDTVFSQGAAEGISTFVASGDAGAAGCDTYFQTPPQSQIASPNYICSSSYSTCVGGTEFADTSDPSAYWSPTNFQWLTSAEQYIPEGGWNEPLNGSGSPQAASSGGGFSSYIPTPSWQTGTGVPGTQGRYTPDVAFSSSAHDGYFGCLAASGGTHPGDCVVQNGEFYFEYFFGTSAAAPGMAGITALLNQSFRSPQGELNQRLYQLASIPAYEVFHDVTVATSGVTGCVVTTPSMCNNSTPSPTGLTGGFSGYLVTDGFDEVTGLGSIDAANLVANWFAGFPTTTTALISSLNPAQLGVPVTFTATVSTSGANQPTGSVTFVDYDDAMGTVALATVNGSQVATLTPPTLGFGTYQITAVYSGDANNASSTSPILNQNIIAPTFTWTANGTTATVLSGQTAVYNFNASPTGTGVTAFGGNVVFSCSGLPDATIACNFNPAQINAGSGATPVQLTITTSGPNAPAGDTRRRVSLKRSSSLLLALPLAGILMVGFAQHRISRVSIVVCLGFCLAFLGLTVGCGGGGANGGGVPPPPANITVSVSAGSPASIFPNDAADGWPAQTAQFTATVTNSSNTAVNWAVTTPNAGTIDANGLFTAPTVASGLPASVTITATSQADPTKSGTGRETLNSATIPATYSNIVVTATESTAANTVPVTLTVQ
jgi:Pro-kumamolisin, activation domain/Bacterial Ig-like domain (group 3)